MKNYNNSEETQKRILDIAVKLFSEDNYVDTSVSKICSLAGVSTASFYHQIGSKEKLIKITYEAHMEETNKLLAEMVDRPAIEKIDFVVDRHIEHALLCGYKYYKYFLKMDLDNKLYPKENNSRPIHRYFKTLTEQGVANNEFNKKYNSNHIHRSILTASIGCFYEWCIAEGNFDLKKELKLHLSILFKEFVK